MHFNIGNYDIPSKTMFFSGKIDEVMLFGKALDEYSIISIYKNKLSGISCTINGVCGNGYRELSEECDDKNLINGDGCSSACKSEIICPSGIVSYWRLDENGTDSVDTNPAQLVNTAYTTASVTGKAPYFDNYSDYGKVSYSNNLDFDQKITLSVWINPILDPKGNFKNGIILAKKYKTNEFYKLYLNGGKRPRLTFEAKGLTKIITPYLDMIRPGFWSHIAVSYNQSFITVYVNGQKIAQGIDQKGRNLTKGYSNIFLGNNELPDKNSNFLGSIDELSIYDKSLNEFEILSLYNAGFTKKSCTPAAATCPNGYVEPGEECDLDYVIENTSDYEWSGCTPDCKMKKDCHESMIGYWKFDGNINDSYWDHISKQYNVSFKEGIIGQSIELNKSYYSYVRINHSYAMNNPYEFSFSAWIYPYPDKYGRVQNGVIASRGKKAFKEFDILLIGGPEPKIQVYLPNIGRYTTIGIDAIRPNKWSHIGVTYTTIQGNYNYLQFFDIYVDGQRVYSNLLSLNPPKKLNTGNMDLTIGNYDVPVKGWNFIGRIDEVSVYYSGLDDSRVRQLYYLGKTSYTCDIDTPVCGNWLPENGEECDDGNNKNLDGCTSDCKIEQQCLSLVGYWKFDHSDGRDYSSKKNNAIVSTGLKFLPGKIGKAMYTTASNFFGVYAKDNESLDFPEGKPFTFLAWVKYPKPILTETDYIILDKETEFSSIEQGFMAGVHGNIYFTYKFQDFDHYIQAYAYPKGYDPSDNKWHLVGFTYNGSGTWDSHMAYFDGEFAHQIFVVHNLSEEDRIKDLNNSAWLDIGSPGYSTGETFNGYIDEVALFDSELSIDAINHMYYLTQSGKDYCYSSPYK